MTEKELLELKEDVEEVKTEVSEKKGEKTALLKQLKSTYNCSSVEMAEKKLKKLKEQREELNTQLEEGLEKLDEKFEDEN